MTERNPQLDAIERLLVAIDRLGVSVETRTRGGREITQYRDPATGRYITAAEAQRRLDDAASLTGIGAPPGPPSMRWTARFQWYESAAGFSEDTLRDVVPPFGARVFWIVVDAPEYGAHRMRTMPYQSLSTWSVAEYLDREGIDPASVRTIRYDR